MELKKIKISQKNLSVLVICFVIGIIFLFLSEYSSFERSRSDDSVFDETAYTASLETRLASILEQVNGVSDVNVMITLEGGITYRYANQTAKSLSGDNSSVETLLQMQEDSGGALSPILTETILPRVKGVSVVCKGAADVNIQKKIIGLVSSALNLNENQIFVTE